MEDFDEENEARPPVKLDFSGRANGGNRSRSFGSDRGAKLRLLSLLGLLLLVIVAMKEAGKPERWMWLGFDEPANPEFVADKDISADDIVVQAEEESADDSGFLTEQQNGQLGYMPDRIASRLTEADGQNGSASDNSAGDRDPQKTPLAVDFWRAAFAKLNDSQQEAFYQLLRRIDTSQLQKPQADLPFDATIKRLNELQKNNQAKTLGAISVMSQGDPKTALTDDLFAFDESWQQHVSPVLEASVKGDDFTIANQTTIRSIRSIIDPIVMQDVEDMTGIGNPRDKLAWRGIWDFVQRDAQSPKTGSASETTLLQLKGQPQAFRSQTVSVSGTALTIRRKTLAKTMLNLDHYYELWVDPPERVNDGLICVYAATLPRDFDSAAIEVSETFQTISIPVKIDGRFFKIRSYQDSGKTVSHCPVVVTETFAADIKANQSKANQSAAAAPWRLSTSNVLAFLVLAAIGAMAIAYVVFRSTQTGSRGISKPASKRLERSFDALAEDDSVLTDAQRVSQLNEYLEEDFS